MRPMDQPASNIESAIPPISDVDIGRIAEHLGVEFDAPRQNVLRSNGNFDVQACPGSGKTTLLVAKLALLAEKWPYARRGICVLSHTNVARLEIEEKLAGTRAGQLLLSYPHFVGTIHSFANEFLALPLLRSEGKKVQLVDDEASGECCRRLLYRVRAYATARGFLSRREQYSPDKTIRSLRYDGPELELGSAAGRLPCGPDAATYQTLAKIKRRAAEAGFWRYDDMFAWAERLASQCPEAIQFVRQRFPVVFIDEMQDTSELQNRILAALFPAEACVIRQRFGDSNQAIYDFGGTRATTDPFPGNCVQSIPNSKRFGRTIAARAQPLAPVPPDPSLVGDGPNRERFGTPLNEEGMPHTIFLFKTRSAGEVLPAFGELLLRTFPDSVICSSAFLARAIGRVGQSQVEDDNVPRHLGHYWSAYEPQAAKLEPRPGRLADYVHLAQRSRIRQNDCAEAVRLAAKGVIELARAVCPTAEFGDRRPARSLREAIAEDTTATKLAGNLIWRWCVETVPITERVWSRQIARVRRALRPVVGDQWNVAADEFCQWSDEFAGSALEEQTSGKRPPNVYHFEDGSRVVDINVGTIHSAKGQTHTATLVLETRFKKNDLTDLLPWLLGEKHGAARREGVERLDRMRLIYTAMTRPSHLLCLAVRADGLGDDPEHEANLAALRSAGWTVQEL